MAEGFSYEEFGNFLLKEGENISNRICSEAFLDLTKSDLKDLAPTIASKEFGSRSMKGIAILVTIFMMFYVYTE